LTSALETAWQVPRPLGKSVKEAVFSLAQSQRQTEESLRKTIEAQRKTEESLRKTNEAQRKTEESLRKMIEAQRKTNEALRKTNEAVRKLCDKVDDLISDWFPDARASSDVEDWIWPTRCTRSCCSRDTRWGSFVLSALMGAEVQQGQGSGVGCDYLPAVIRLPRQP
jgi:hypothetical protein